MKQYTGPRRRNTLRLPNFDYSGPGAYFVTICTRDRVCLLGHIHDGQMVLNHVGHIVRDTWMWLGKRYDHVDLDAWVIMPNHLHGIIILHDGRGGSRTAPTEKRKPLGRLIGAFKTISTKRVNEIRKTPGMQLWQRNYYEHVIRGEQALAALRKYIVENPAKWSSDLENPLMTPDAFKNTLEPAR
ncbi:MAG: transposase [Bacteroidetes bacterium]|nr:MAG: transposase [Bacteroidota bacterium]